MINRWILALVVACAMLFFAVSVYAEEAKPTECVSAETALNKEFKEYAPFKLLLTLKGQDFLYFSAGLKQALEALGQSAQLETNEFRVYRDKDDDLHLIDLKNDCVYSISVIPAKDAKQALDMIIDFYNKGQGLKS